MVSWCQSARAEGPSTPSKLTRSTTTLQEGKETFEQSAHWQCNPSASLLIVRELSSQPGCALKGTPIKGAFPRRQSEAPGWNISWTASLYKGHRRIFLMIASADTSLDAFYLSDEDLLNSPSFQDGVDQVTEFSLRLYGCDLIVEACIYLRLCVLLFPCIPSIK